MLHSEELTFTCSGNPAGLADQKVYGQSPVRVVVHLFDFDVPFFASAQQLFVFEGCAILYKENHQIFEETDRII